jgi:hypothetical protein
MKKTPAELHISCDGKLGFGLGLQSNHVAFWTNNLRLWLIWLNLIKEIIKPK